MSPHRGLPCTPFESKLMLIRERFADFMCKEARAVSLAINC